MLAFLVLGCSGVDHQPASAAPAPVQRSAEPTTEPAPPPMTCIQPLGPYDAGLAAVAARGIEHVWGFPTRVLQARDLPREAWYEPRQRYRADTILDWLDRSVVPGSGCDIAVGFTRVDISTTKDAYVDWGVFGLGEIGGTSAAVSTHRLGGWPQATADRRTVAIRTVKVVNHEVGHVLGLPHGGAPGCMMNDAEGTIKTVDVERGLVCEPSKAWVREHRGLELPALAAVDWDAVIGPQ